MGAVAGDFLAILSHAATGRLVFGLGAQYGV